MKSIYSRNPDLSTDEAARTFFREAILYRNLHKKESEDIARFVFDATHEAATKDQWSEELKRIRYEFGALEAPGLPEGGVSETDYVDGLWLRLRSILENKEDSIDNKL